MIEPGAVGLSGALRLRLVPVTLRDVRRFIAEHHRHNEPPHAWRFGVGLSVNDEQLVAVAVAGRPISRVLDDGLTIEIVRVCVDPTSPAAASDNAASRLYGALCRAAAALGYRRAITYTLTSELGVSLRASGFAVDGLNRTHEHRHSDGKPRARDRLRLFDDPKLAIEDKIRWVREL